MELITSNAEQQACEHIRPYQNTPSGLFAAFFDLSRTPFAASSQRGIVKSFFAQELKDVQAIIFQFLNGDIFVISTRLTMHHVHRIKEKENTGKNTVKQFQKNKKKFAGKCDQKEIVEIR